jgi:hypothetical protein
VFAIAVPAPPLRWWYAQIHTDSGPDSSYLRRRSACKRCRPTAATQRHASIDALAAAVVFERAYIHRSLPARVAAGGTAAVQHGVRDEIGFALKENARPLAELLRNRGFETGAAVSSFLLRPESGVAQGFSFFDAELPDEPGGPSPVVERAGAQTTDAAVRWLRSRKGHRFFLFVQVNEDAAESTVKQLVWAQDLDLATVDHRPDGRSRRDRHRHDAQRHLARAAARKQPAGEGRGRVYPSAHRHSSTVLDLVRAHSLGLRGRAFARWRRRGGV